MSLIEKKVYKILLLSFLLFIFSISQGQVEEFNEEILTEIVEFILVLYPEVVTISDSDGAESILMLVNIGNKPIILGNLDRESGNNLNGVQELRVSIDINDAPLRYLRLADNIAVSTSYPYINANLISEITTIMPGSALWMSLSALPIEDMDKSKEGVAKFRFTFLSLVNEKIKPLIELGFSIRYKLEKQLDDTRLINAGIEIDKGNISELSAVQ